MPRGVTPIRVRRRQSDAKWRASVAMCYNIMKNVIPNQKKLGRRKVSKALTLKETERHIANLERRLRELIEERAPMCGKTIMIEKEDKGLTPATMDDVKQDFASKQHALFMCMTTGGKKRYNVPSDIEASLEQLSQQSCNLVAMDHKELETSYPNLLKMMDTPRFKPQESVESSSKLQSLLNTPVEDSHCAYSNVHKTPSKNHSMSFLPDSVKTASKPENDLKPNTLKVCKQLPFSNQSTSRKTKPVLLPSWEKFIHPSIETLHTSTQTGINSSPDGSEASFSQSLRSVDDNVVQKYSLKSSQDKKLSSHLLSQKSSKSSSHRNHSQGSSQVSSGFTPVKLPFGLSSRDPMLTFSGTPVKSTAGSPLGCLSIPETPGTCFTGADYLELTDDEDMAGLLCTESIDSIDLEKTFSNKSSVENEENNRNDDSETSNKMSEESKKNSATKTKVCRRLDRDYGSSKDQTVCTTDKSCLEFDGYLLFHKHNAALMDPGCSSSEKALTIADMWENLEPEDRSRYARIASLDQSDDSIDLSADLLGIDLKPLHKEHAEIETVHEGDGSQEVPDLVLNLSEEMHKNYEFQFIEGFEDLGMFYQNDVIKKDFSRESSEGLEGDSMSQIVPEMG